MVPTNKRKGRMGQSTLPEKLLCSEAVLLGSSSQGAALHFTEGPVWQGSEEALYFSDIIGNSRHRWTAHDGIRTVDHDTNKGNGMTFDADGRLLVCEHVTSVVSRINISDGTRQVLCSHFEGKALNSPNDIVVKSDGSIFFTDPPYGRLTSKMGLERNEELGFSGVYCLKGDHVPGADPELVVDKQLFSRPNGLTFSPDEALLYVNDTSQGNIRVFQVLSDGSLVNGRVFASGLLDPEVPGKPDGMKCDQAGRVYCTGPGGIWVFDASGERLGCIALDKSCANMHWGGKDFSTLFCTCLDSIYSVQMKVSGRAEPFMKRVNSFSASKVTGEALTAEPPLACGSIPRRKLGKTGLMVSMIALGGLGIGSARDNDLYGGVTDEQAVETVRHAIKRGMNLIDTSPLYQESERRLGLAIATLSSEERSNLIICTKIGDDCPPYSDNGGHSPFSRLGVLSSIRHSCKLLGVTHIDIILLHDPTVAEVAAFFDSQGGIHAIIEMQRQGVIGHFGLGVQEHEVHQAFLAQAKDTAAVLLTVNDHNLLRRSVAGTSWETAAAQKVGILNAGVFYMGLLADPENSWKMGFKASLDKPKLVQTACEMQAWCRENGVVLRDVALRFALDNPNVSSVPIGCRSPQEIDEIISSLTNPALTDAIYHQFMEEFDVRVAALTTADHFYYNKSKTKI